MNIYTQILNTAKEYRLRDYSLLKKQSVGKQEVSPLASAMANTSRRFRYNIKRDKISFLSQEEIKEHIHAIDIRDRRYLECDEYVVKKWIGLREQPDEGMKKLIDVLYYHDLKAADTYFSTQWDTLKLRFEELPIVTERMATRIVPDPTLPMRAIREIAIAVIDPDFLESINPSQADFIKAEIKRLNLTTFKGAGIPEQARAIVTILDPKIRLLRIDRTVPIQYRPIINAVSGIRWSMQIPLSLITPTHSDIILINGLCSTII